MVSTVLDYSSLQYSLSNFIIYGDYMVLTDNVRYGNQAGRVEDFLNLTKQEMTTLMSTEWLLNPSGIPIF